MKSKKIIQLEKELFEIVWEQALESRGSFTDKLFQTKLGEIYAEVASDSYERGRKDEREEKAKREG